MKQLTFKKEAWIIIVPLLILAIILLSSCQKEKLVQPQDVGKTFVRVQEVDNNGNVQYSSIYTVIVKN